MVVIVVPASEGDDDLCANCRVELTLCGLFAALNFLAERECYGVSFRFPCNRIKYRDGDRQFKN